MPDPVLVFRRAGVREELAIAVDQKMAAGMSRTDTERAARSS
jgi:hypothetical protein